MKKFLAVTLALTVILAVFSGCGGGGASGKAIDLRMNITISETSTWMQGAERFAELIDERTEGRYKISIFPNEQLSGGNQAKGVEMVQSGATDIDIHSTIIWSAVDQRLTVINMPWLFTDYEEADKAFAGAGGEAIMEIMRGSGVVPLAFGEAGFRQITNNTRAILTPEDMVGIKVRVPGIAMYIDLFQTLGADPTTMNFGEVFTSLQQGTIDGQENPLDIIYTNKLQEVQDYMTMWNYSYDVLLFSVSEKTWGSLSEEDKVIFQGAAEEAMAYQKSQARTVNDTYLEELKDDVIVTELTTEQMLVFRDKAAPVYDSYRDTIGGDLYTAFGFEG